MSDNSPVSKGMFIDEVDIIVAAGAGGNGCMSFRREKHVPRGGPNGGDGGNGGNVYLVADPQYNTLQHLAGHHHWKADRGGHGTGKNCHGRNGPDVNIRVPPGTMIHDSEIDVLLKDLTEPGERVRVAAGGKGGRGNAAFKSPTNQAPRVTETGEDGQQRKLHLTLKLIADVGLVGKPNAGKSTLLARLSAARPKIAAYPFTTLHPCLGIVELDGWRRMVMADIPGLIEGAHEGAGLGDEFLRHIERTRVLVHLVDLCPVVGDPAADYHAIGAELERYSPALAAKPKIVAANKMDLTGSDEAFKRFAGEIDAEPIAISGVTGHGLGELTERLWQILQEQDDQCPNRE